MKQRKCMNCATPFTPDRMGQKACSPRCAYQSVEKAKDKAFNAVTRQKRKEWRDNDKHTQAELAKKACHEYIRYRDRELGCISCGTTDDVQYAAGHYRPSGVNSALRYSELNIHKQCNKYCNSANSGNLIAYRANLILKIGADVVQWLDDNHEVKRWTIDELKAIQAHYKAKLKELKCRG